MNRRNRVSRRTVLRALASMGGAAFTAACSSSTASPAGSAGAAELDAGVADALADLGLDGGAQRRTALVVGTGYGGAIAALRLAQAGVRVTMLERGRAWPLLETGDTFATTFAPDGRSTWLRDQTVLPLGPQFPIDPYIGVLGRHDFEEMQIYTGNGVGGGSLVYGCMTVEPSPELFDRTFDGLLDFSEMQRDWFPLVRRMLAASPVPDDIWEAEFYQMSHRFRAAAEQAGIATMHIDLAADWDVMRAEMRGDLVAAAITGELIYGANSGYKNSLDLNYLPQALATGNASIVTQTNVVGIDRSRTGTWVAQVQEIDEQGAVAAEREYEADMLFMGAGSIGTTELLLRAQGSGVLAGLNNDLGTRWGTNGNVMFMRSGLNVDTGRTQANPPVLAAVYLDNPHTPIIIENAPFPIGFECNCSLQLAVSSEPGQGRLMLGAQTGAFELDWPEGALDKELAAVRAFSAQMAAIDDGQIGGTFLPEATDSFTYHPLGGAVMGSVCDPFGRVRDAEGLYVMDSSLIPGTVGCANPSLTIAAIAERAMADIVAKDLG